VICWILGLRARVPKNWQWVPDEIEELIDALPPELKSVAAFPTPPTQRRHNPPYDRRACAPHIVIRKLLRLDIHKRRQGNARGYGIKVGRFPFQANGSWWGPAIMRAG